MSNYHAERKRNRYRIFREIFREESWIRHFARLADTYLELDKVDITTELCEDGIKKHTFYTTGHFILGKCYLAKKK